jgi:peptidoglycan/xylan/chitin deacetylase (PgdA/CDA1 family)
VPKTKFPPARRFTRRNLVLALATSGVAIISVVASRGVASLHTPARVEARLATVVRVSPPNPTPLDDPVLPATTIQDSTGARLVVPILMYHYIRVNPVPTDKVGFGLSVTPDAFATQMAYLHSVGAHTVTLAQVMAALKGGPGLPPRSVVLTFDDGHDDFATQAVPIMKRYGFVGTDYVVPGFLGHTSYMTSDQVKQVYAEGMVIGAHTVHHVALADVSYPVAQAEIDGSKQLLEQLLGHPVLDFAYPYGSYDPAVGNLVRLAGFRDAVTTYSSDVQYASLPFVLNRYKVGGGESLAAFAAQALLPPPPLGWTGPTAAQLLNSPATAAPKPSATPSLAN